MTFYFNQQSESETWRYGAAQVVDFVDFMPSPCRTILFILRGSES